MSDTSTASLVIMFSLLAALKNPLWVDPEGTVKTLQDQGYTNVETTGYGWLSCGRDTFCTGFEAKSPNGRDVSGVVGKGLFFKGKTVRLD